MKTTHQLLFIVAISMSINANSQHLNPFVLSRNTDENPKIEFIENQGQWAEDFLYKAALGGNGMLYIQKDGLIFDFIDPSDLLVVDSLHHHLDLFSDSSNLNSISIHHHAWKLEFSGASKNFKCESDAPFNHYYNYFLGNDPMKWKSRIHPSLGIVLKDLWPGIDMHLTSVGDNLKYRFDVSANADYRQIKLVQHGLSSWHVQNEALVMKTTLDEYYDTPPIAICGTENVQVTFELAGDTLRFACLDCVAGLPLDIDPTLIAATYVGAGGNTWGNFALSNLNDELIVVSEPKGDFMPTTFGAFQEVISIMNTNTSMAISQFSQNGELLQWCTYLNGNSIDQLETALVGPDNSIYLMGITLSNDFPTTLYAFDYFLSGASDLFISRLSADGSELLSSTFVGGASGDGGRPGFPFFVPVLNAEYPIAQGQFRGAIHFDSLGNLVIATSRVGFTDFTEIFPNTTVFGDSFSNSDYSNFLIFELDADLTTMHWATTVGGTEKDNICDMTVLSNGNIAFCGSTASDDIPITNDVFQTQISDSDIEVYDGYIAVLNEDGTELIAASYLGWLSQDEIQFIDEDPSGNIWMCGLTSADNENLSFPYHKPDSKTYIAKLDSNLTELLGYSTIGSPTGFEDVMIPTAFMVDVCGRVYICGHPTTSDGTGIFEGDLDLTNDALQTIGGFYLAVFEPNMAALDFATLIGGDHIDAGASQYNRKGIVFQGVCAPNDSGFLPTINAFDETPAVGPTESAAFVIDFQSPSVISQFSYVPTQQWCTPATFQFENNSDSASYSWNFGDGSGWQSNQASNVWHEFYTPGDYYVQLAATNTESCNYSDTTGWWITVPDGISTLVNSMDYSNTDLCVLPVEAEFSYTGTGETSFNWQDAEGNVIGEEINLELSFDEVDDYTVLLIANDAACNYSDTITTIISPSPAADASFTTMDGLLTAAANSSYQWYLNDEMIDGATEQTYQATETGNYSVEVTNEFGCVATSDDQLVEVGVQELLSNDIILFPNPVGDELTITFHSAASRTIKLLDAEGRLVKDFGVISKKMFSVDCSALASGAYFIQVVSTEGDVVAKGFVKE